MRASGTACGRAVGVSTLSVIAVASAASWTRYGESVGILRRWCAPLQALDHHDAAGRIGPAGHQVNLNIPTLARLAKLHLGILTLREHGHRTGFHQQRKA